MKTISINANEKEIADLLVEWTELLAQEKYSEALNMFQAYHHELVWTPELLESAVFTYGVPGYTREEAEKMFGSSHYKVTSLLQSPDKDKILGGIDIVFYDENTVTEQWAQTRCLTQMDYENIIGDVHYFDVPINGEMSDLTARFYIKKLDAQSMTLSFQDLHVM